MKPRSRESARLGIAHQTDSVGIAVLRLQSAALVVTRGVSCRPRLHDVHRFVASTANNMSWWGPGAFPN